MATVSILYWRDMPSQIVAKQGRKSAKLMLHDRFQEAIDMAAMRSKAHDSDAYLEGWRRGDPVDCDSDLEKVADDMKQHLEQKYDAAALDNLTKSDGWEQGNA